MTDEDILEHTFIDNMMLNTVILSKNHYIYQKRSYAYLQRLRQGERNTSYPVAPVILEQIFSSLVATWGYTPTMPCFHERGNPTYRSRRACVSGHVAYSSARVCACAVQRFSL